MKKRLKTLSKHFYNDEIIAIDTDGTLHIKEGVRKVKFWPQLKQMGVTFTIADLDNDLTGTSEHFNEFRKIQDKLDFVRKISEEERNFND